MRTIQLFIFNLLLIRIWCLKEDSVVEFIFKIIQYTFEKDDFLCIISDGATLQPLGTALIKLEVKLQSISYENLYDIDVTQCQGHIMIFEDYCRLKSVFENNNTFIYGADRRVLIFSNVTGNFQDDCFTYATNLLGKYYMLFSCFI